MDNTKRNKKGFLESLDDDSQTEDTKFFQVFGQIFKFWVTISSFWRHFQVFKNIFQVRTVK